MTYKKKNILFLFYNYLGSASDIFSLKNFGDKNCRLRKRCYDREHY